MWVELGKAVVVVKKMAEELIKQSRKQAVQAGWGWLLFFIEKIGEYMMMVVSQPKGVLAKALADEWAMLNGNFEREGV